MKNGEDADEILRAAAEEVPRQIGLSGETADVIDFQRPGDEVAIEEKNGIKRQIVRKASPNSTTVVATTHWPEGQKPGSTRATSGMAAFAKPELVSFNRRELDQILRVYGFKVAEGEWRDYAIDMLKDRAVFSVFRRANDVPLYCIEKNPKLARRQGQWSVTGSGGQVLKRGHDLARVLQFLEKKPRLKLV